MVKIYWREGCAKCKTLKYLLGRKGIDYEYVYAEGQEYENLANQYGVSVPLVVIGETVLCMPPITQVLELAKA